MSPFKRKTFFSSASPEKFSFLQFFAPPQSCKSSSGAWRGWEGEEEEGEEEGEEEEEEEEMRMKRKKKEKKKRKKRR